MSLIRQVRDKFKFSDEASLENFLWFHLPELLQLFPLARQLEVKGETCDILAVNCEGKLHVIEVKNTVDRYLVQQLTRYYDNLIDKQPNLGKVNYSLGIQMLGIAPEFHHHNWIDLKYNTLPIHFFEFWISQGETRFFYNLHNPTSREISQYEITDLVNSETSPPNPESRKERVERTLNYYILVQNAHKLGLPEPNLRDLKLISPKTKRKPPKCFQIVVNDLTPKKNYRRVTIRVPSWIGVADFYNYVVHNIETARSIVTPNGRGMNCSSNLEKFKQNHKI